MATMTMVEKSDETIYWECSACEAEVKDKKDFEDKVKVCPECGEEITKFYSLYDENGEYADE